MAVENPKLPTIAYVVLAHTHPEQLARMVHALRFENARFFVHIDRSVAIAPFKASLPPSDDLTYINPREDGHWGSFGIVRASLNGLRAAVSPHNGPIPDFVGLLSGLDYPLQTPLQIARFLDGHRGQSFIEHRPLPIPTLRRGGLDRVEHYSVSWRRRRYTYYPTSVPSSFNWRGRVSNAMLGILLSGRAPRRHPDYAAPHYGSQWWLISREAAEAIIGFVDRHPDFERYHEDTLLADELFFQTIVASPENAHLRGKLINQNMHFIRWPEGSSSPAFLGCADVATLAGSGRLFARKLDSALDPDVLDRLDDHMRLRPIRVERRSEAAPVASVRLITYMQEAYVRQALDGILSQRTDFPFEVVIGEDNGTDRTRAICEEYAGKHPEVIRLLPLAPRRGMVGNHLETLRECRGEYVALCDGDDYWIDAEKLQLQVNLLRQHPECSLSFHNAFTEYPGGRRERWLEGPFPEGYGVEHLFDEWLITTSSMAFRNPRFDFYPRFMEIATHEDLALMVFLGRQGRIDYISRTMSVYRRHPESVMASFRGIQFATKQIEFLREIDHWSKGTYAQAINRRIAGLMRSRALSWADEGERFQAIREMFSSVTLSARPLSRVFGDSLRLSLELAGLRDAAARLGGRSKAAHHTHERP